MGDSGLGDLVGVAPGAGAALSRDGAGTLAPMSRITFQADDRSQEAEADEWLYDVCVAGKASIPFSCKAGACGMPADRVHFENFF